MMRVCFDDVTLKEKRVMRELGRELTIFGDCWEEPPSCLSFLVGNSKEFTISSLDFDGGYTAFYRNDQEGAWFIVQGSIDLFSMFYTCKDNTIFFSDDWYSLLKYTDEKGCIWDIEAISDYFEGTWNNIVKYDRSPICEIRRLDRGTYIEIHDNQDTYDVRKWDETYRSEGNYKYNSNNLEEFKNDFFVTLDYYLGRISSRYKEVTLTTSGGLDCNTITAEFCKKYPDVNKRIFTSKIGGEKDESELALKMKEVIKEPIELIRIQLNNEDLISRLESYIERNLPPRYFNELSEDEICRSLKSRGHRNVISGMGAENIFGFFDNEYYYLVKEYFDKLDFSRAYNVFTAAKVSYNGFGTDEINRHFIRFIISYFNKKNNEKVLHKERINREKNPYLRCDLHESSSSEIDSWSDAIEYATYSGELKAMWYDYEKNGVKILFPFAGRKFVELGNFCDPYIFSDRVNKSCLRYAVKELLPDGIVNNSMKTGNPGQDYREVVFDKENYRSIRLFLESNDSTIVDKEYLLKQLYDNKFGHYEFLALSLVVFENIVKRKYGRDINVQK